MSSSSIDEIIDIDAIDRSIDRSVGRRATRATRVSSETQGDSRRAHSCGWFGATTTTSADVSV